MAGSRSRARCADRRCNASATRTTRGTTVPPARRAGGRAFGGGVVRADRRMHGKTCEGIHEGDELFEGIPSPVTGMRYHSLVVEPRSLPKDLVITAWSADRPKDGEIMAMKHRRHPIYGVQYHPESIGTSHGKQLLENFLRIAHATA